MYLGEFAERGPRRRSSSGRDTPTPGRFCPRFPSRPTRKRRTSRGTNRSGAKFRVRGTCPRAVGSTRGVLRDRPWGLTWPSPSRSRTDLDNGPEGRLTGGRHCRQGRVEDEDLRQLSRSALEHGSEPNSASRTRSATGRPKECWRRRSTTCTTRLSKPPRRDGRRLRIARERTDPALFDVGDDHQIACLLSMTTIRIRLHGPVVADRDQTVARCGPLDPANSTPANSKRAPPSALTPRRPPSRGPRRCGRTIASPNPVPLSAVEYPASNNVSRSSSGRRDRRRPREPPTARQ